MAPKRNRAKPQRGSFLSRGREQVRQRQQTRQQASRQLPPEGGTSAGSLKARGQRTATAVQQKVQRDIATTRALADMMQRNKARADRQIPADKSPSVRRVGPGGANPKPQGQLPPGQRGGDMRQKGGPLATRDKGGPMTQRGGGMTRTNNGGPVSEVNVRDMGNSPQRQLPGQRGLPGGTGGADRVTASGARTGQPGANRNALPAGRQGGAMATRPRTNGVATGLALAAGEMAVRPLARAAGQKLGEALRPLGRAIDDRMKGTNSKDEAQRNARRKPLPQMTPTQNKGAVRLGQASPADVGRKAPTPTRSGSGSGSPARSTSGSGAGGGSRGSSTQSGGGSTQSRSASPSRASSAPSAPFKGTVDEGRMIWAQKYSSDKYKGQAINDEAKKLLEKLKVKKGDGQSAANKAGWDGNKNY